MEVFPFTEKEWCPVREAARAAVNATLAGETVLRASWLARLRLALAGLRRRYGDHPVLLETEADFADMAAERVALYARAKGAALARGLPTLSIRLSLAGVLLEEMAQPAAARKELVACRDELAAAPDASDRKVWSDLLAACDGRTECRR